MLPDFIRYHLYFHQNLNEENAKKVLLSKQNEENFLFIQSNTENECLLLYKAVFRGNTEVRTLKITYDSESQTLNNSSLGCHADLHSLIKRLPSFLNGFTSISFKPTPVAQFDSSNGLVFPSLHHDLAKRIFTFFDGATLKQTSLVSKAYYQLSASSKINRLEENWLAQQKEIENCRKKVGSIYDALLILLPPANPPAYNLAQIKFNKFSITKTHWYSSYKILFDLTTPEYQAVARIAKNSSCIELFNAPSPTVENNLLEGILSLCNHALNQKKTREEYEREDMHALQCN